MLIKRQLREWTGKPRTGVWQWHMTQGSCAKSVKIFHKSELINKQPNAKMGKILDMVLHTQKVIPVAKK